MARLAQNDAEAEIPFTGYNNEIGEMARAVAIFRDNTLERAKLEIERESEVERTMARQDALEELIASFKSDTSETIAALSVMAADLDRTASGLQDIASGTNDKAQVVATASDQASANVGTVAAAAEQLTASISEIGNQISVALANVNDTSSMTITTNERMSELLASAQEIGQVVTLIREIAGQTNLLALNATIEAARAGEAGRGFAVVATEVKTLATRTAQATESISKQVTSIQVATDEAVRAIGEIASRVSHVNGITTQIAAAVTEQGSATSEINASVHHAAGDTRHVSETIAGVTEAASSTYNSASQCLADQRQRERADKGAGRSHRTLPGERSRRLIDGAGGRASGRSYNLSSVKKAGAQSAPAFVVAEGGQGDQGPSICRIIARASDLSAASSRRASLPFWAETASREPVEGRPSNSSGITANRRPLRMGD